MRVCPVDMQGCCDDICRGAGCVMADGEPMIEICEICKREVGEDCICFDECAEDPKNE